jgi:hypothetical protein
MSIATQCPPVSSTYVFSSFLAFASAIDLSRFSLALSAPAVTDLVALVALFFAVAAFGLNLGLNCLMKAMQGTPAGAMVTLFVEEGSEVDR